MTDLEILEIAKDMQHYTGDYHDKYLLGWIRAAKTKLRLSGVSEEAIESENSVGAIVQYVLDLDNKGEVSGGTLDLIAQLALTYPRG